MISSTITKANTLVLALAGLVLLFAADNVLPIVVQGYPPAGYWLGQVLGAALLGLANFNYFSRTALLGGIYGRAVVASNTTFYFIAVISLLKSGALKEPGPLFLAVTITAAVFALLYGWLLYRGPFERDLRAAQLASSETNPTIRT